MKIKSQPTDFIVAEDATLGKPGGPFSVYLLEKTDFTTIDAVANVARAFNLKREQVRHGGLKDRHAVTRQHVWIENGPEKSLEQPGLSLRHLGRFAEPPAPRGNRFEITLRALSDIEASRLPDAATNVRTEGVPNYFDSQRFGSARHGHGFVGKKILLRQYEDALRLHFTKSSDFDTESRKKRMAALQRHWGHWEHCLEKAATRTEDHVFSHLMRHRGDFAGALKRIERPMLALFMHTYQSFLWNEAVGKFLKLSLPSDVLMATRYLGGRLIFHRFVPADLVAAWKSTTIPLLAYRTKFRDPVVERAYREVLGSERLEQAQFKPAGHNLPYMKAEERALLLFPEEMKAEGAEADDLNPGKQKARLSFRLPRGGYATLIVKKLKMLAGADSGDEEGRREGGEPE